jgi:predicted AlkP superfamily phosphohydrolase/phosphomutase
VFWRFRDPKHPLYNAEGAQKYGRAVEDTYARMDQIVGKVMEKLAPEDLLMVMSDHGFKSFRRAFSVNTWLIRNGYLAVKGQGDAAAAFTDEKFLKGFDWSKSRAYGLGLGSIYLNLAGREGQGTVTAEQAPALLAEIKQKLLELTDPETGEKVFTAVYLKSDTYKGASESDAPDIQLGYADGYQTEKASVAGAAPKDVLSANADKWSAEHAAADVATTPGILFSNKKLGVNPAIIDLGVTALKYLAVPPAPAFEGKPLI